MNYKKINAQVLLITILVLTIVGIIVVGIVAISNKDVSQVVVSEKYERLYNNSETELRKLIDNFGRYDKQLDTITQAFNYCQAVVVSNEYKCNIEDAASANANFKTEITVTNKKEIIDYEIKKDRALVLDVKGYNSGVDLTWSNSAAMEIGLVVQDASKNLRVIKDIYDLSGVYEGLQSDDPYSLPNPKHVINFSIIDAGNKPNSTRVTLTTAGITGLAATDRIFYMTIVPRIKADFGSVKIQVKPQNTSIFPYQLREFVSTSYDKEDTASPAAKIITQIPLVPQMEAILDYGFITDSELSIL